MVKRKENLTTGARWLGRFLLVSLVGMLLEGCGGGSSPTSISLSANSLSFSVDPQGNNAQPQTITATYKGSGVVVGYGPGITPLPELNIQPVDTSTPGSTLFQVSLAAVGQAPGTRTTTLRFATGVVPVGGTIDDATDVVYADLPINETVYNLVVAPARLDLTAIDGSSTSIAGNLSLTIDSGTSWTATSDQPWLTVTPSGTGPGNISYQVDFSKLALGSHAATISVISSGGHTALVPVLLQIGPPLLVTTPTAPVINVGSDLSVAGRSVTLAVSDDLGGSNRSKILSWSLSSINTAFFDVAPTSGTSAPGNQIQVTANAQELMRLPNADNYSGSFNLSYVSEDGIQRYLIVTVTMNLHSPLATIALTPATPTTVTGYGLSVQFTATGTNGDGYQQDLTSQASWASSNTSVATLGNPTASVAQPVTPGVSTVTASLPGSSVTGSTLLTVQAATGYAYAFSGTKAISEYVYGDNGVLTPLVPASIPNAGGSGAILLSSSGKYLYALGGAGTISQYSIGANGLLTPLATPTVSSGASSTIAITEDSSGHFVYLSDLNTNSVFQFAEGTDGSLTALTPLSVPAGNLTSFVVADRTRPYVYAENGNDETISQYAIGSSGSLVPLSPATVTAGYAPFALASDPGGQNIYALIDPLSSQNGTIQQFSVGAGGTLALHSSTDSGPAPRKLIFVPSGKNAYVLNTGSPTTAGTGGSISQYNVAADGSLSEISGAASVNLNGYLGGSFAIDPAGKYFYVDYDGTFNQFSIGANGALTLVNNAIADGGGSNALVLLKKASP